MIYGNCIKRVLDFSIALVALAALLVPFLVLAVLLAAANRGTPFSARRVPAVTANCSASSNSRR